MAVDFHDPSQVERYDSRQGTDIQEESRLVRSLGISAEDVVIELKGMFATSIALILGYWSRSFSEQDLLSEDRKFAIQRSQFIFARRCGALPKGVSRVSRSGQKHSVSRRVGSCQLFSSFAVFCG